MRANEGSVDRYLRMALGLVFYAVAIMLGGTGVWATICWILGTLMVVTSITGFCLLYQLFGMNTCKR